MLLDDRFNPGYQNNLGLKNLCGSATNSCFYYHSRNDYIDAIKICCDRNAPELLIPLLEANNTETDYASFLDDNFEDYYRPIKCILLQNDKVNKPLRDKIMLISNASYDFDSILNWNNISHDILSLICVNIIYCLIENNGKWGTVCDIDF
jgi:hypothetical protein